MRRWAVAWIVVVVASCDGLLDPTREIDGLEFRGSAEVVQLSGAGVSPEPLIVARVDVRNVSLRPIERIFDGGCFVRRLQAFLETDAGRRLAWDSDRAEPRACTDDLALVDLRPGESASPANWRFGLRLSEIRDSLPAGRYEIAIWIGPDGDPVALGAGELDLD